MKRLFSIALVLAFLPITSALAQTSAPQVVCTPQQQYQQNETDILCKVLAPSSDTFLIAEISFPFQITEVLHVSSPYSSAVSVKYPNGIISTAEQTTLVTTSISLGSLQSPAGFTAAPLNKLTYLLKTNQSMRSIALSSTQNGVQIDLLSPNPSDIQNPFFDTRQFPLSIQFDQSLILESFTQYEQPSIIQFLRLGAACYLQDPFTCAANIVDNL